MNKVIVDKARLLRRVIIISWITLALCFVVKIFGGNLFEIMCNNPNYKALCDYLDTHIWFEFLIAILSSMLVETLYLLAIIQKLKFTKIQFIITFISVCISCTIKILFTKYGIIADIWITLILPILFLGKNYNKYICVLFAILFSLGFQIISLLVRNLAIEIIDYNTFISLIYNIDVYLMSFLYYLYRNTKKEK